MIDCLIDNSTQCNGKYSAYLCFDYDKYIVEVIRALPTRYYYPESKEWEIPLKKLEEVKNKLSMYEWKETYTENVAEHTETVSIPSDYTFVTKPYEYQLEGIKYGLQHDSFLLADEQGTGKTKQMIDLACIRKKLYGYKHCLIIACINSTKLNWRHEVSIHSNEQSLVLGMRTRKNGREYVGSTQDKLADLKALSADSPYFIITNVETLRDKDISAYIRKLCDNNTISMCVVDEFHKAANTTSQQGKSLQKIQTKCRVALTGTPILNRPLDAYGILKWLGYEKHNLTQFKQHHCRFGGYGSYQIVGYKNLQDIQDTLDDMMLRRLKKDVLDLPDKVIIEEYLEMGTKQEKIYKECIEQFKRDIDLVKTSPNPLSQMIRMRQATGYTGILSSTVKESVKFERLAQIVDDAIENKDCVVCFTQWTSVSKPCVEYLITKGYKVATITGETSDIDRKLIVDNFQEGCYDVLVGTIGAIGTGINLYKAHIEVFLDVPWTRAVFDQATDRCHRIGQTNKVTIYNLVCRGTIDEKIWRLVKKKGNVSDVLLKDVSTNTDDVTELINSIMEE